MIKILRYQLNFLLAGSLLVTSGCTLDEPVDSTNDPALTLNYEQHLSVIDLSWDKVKVTGFKEYIILQSSKDIPNRPTPEVSQDITILKRIKDVDQNSLSTSNVLFSEQVCYKLYCAVDDRFLYSPTVCVTQTFDVVEGFFDKACHTSGIDEMTVYDRVNDQLATINYKTGVITNQVTDIVLNFPSLQMDTWNNTTNVIGFNQSPAWLRKYNFLSLTATQSKSYNNILWSAYAFNQFVFMATEEFNKNFQVLNRNTLNIIDSRPGTMSSQNIAVFDGNPITVLTIGQNDSKKYTIDGNGSIVSQVSIPGRILSPDLQGNAAQGADIFIAGQTGNIINRNGDNVGSLITNVNDFISVIRLSDDNTKALYVMSNNSVHRLAIADVSTPSSPSIIKTYDLPSLTYSDIIPESDIIYVVGTTFNSSFPQTFILKYPW